MYTLKIALGLLLSLVLPLFLIPAHGRARALARAALKGEMDVSMLMMSTEWKMPQVSSGGKWLRIWRL